MSTLPFTTLDVFTPHRYAGNPLAIISVPSTVPLSQPTKQLIAREFNLSEVVFLHPRADAAVPEWTIDIFTTSEELPFAGHPTVGTSWWVSQHEAVAQGVLLTKAGRIPFVRTGDGVEVFVPHDVHVHARTLGDVGSGGSLGLGAAELAAPVVSIVRGMTFVLVRLGDLEALGRVVRTGRKVGVPGLLDEEWAPSFVGVYYFVVLEGEKREGPVRVRTRMVEEGMEDPATGSAACALSCYLALERGEGGTRKFEIVQGVEMGRRSEIGVEVVVGGEGREVESVKLKGGAVEVMSGSLTV